MARLNVNPTRMELKKLKGRLSTATRGHKLLKDKTDEMIRIFTIYLKKAKALRDEVNGGVKDIFSSFALASGLESEQSLALAFAMPTTSVTLNAGVKTVMGITVPDISVADSYSEELPYAYGEITSEADESVKAVGKLIPKLLQLCQIEKIVRVMSLEIERNKRRVNALEYVMIPQLEETIKYIRAKLDENERASVIRMMKVKNK